MENGNVYEIGDVVEMSEERAALWNAQVLTVEPVEADSEPAKEEQPAEKPDEEKKEDKKRKRSRRK